MRAMEGIKDPVVVLSPDNMIIHANSAFAELAGMGHGDLQDKDSRRITVLSPIQDVIASVLSGAADESVRLSLDNRHFEAFVSSIGGQGEESSRVIVHMKDITGFSILEEELVKRNRDLLISNALARTFIASDDMSSIYEDLLSRAMAVTELSIGIIALFEERALKVECVRGISGPISQPLECPWLGDFLDRIARTESPMVVMESREDGIPDEMWKHGARFLVCIPLRSQGEDLGLLIMGSRLELTLDFDMASILSVTGNMMSLLSDKIRLFNEARRLSLTDPLTGLYNTRFFYEELSREVERSQRYGKPFSIILYDVDNFKSVNDNFGHQAGDEVLRSIAHILMGAARSADTVARYGGEEFILILPETDRDKAASLAERIRKAVESSIFQHNEDSIDISISGGVACCPQDSPSAKGLLYCADMAMYMAKGLGKNRVVCFEGKGR